MTRNAVYSRAYNKALKEGKNIVVARREGRDAAKAAFDK